MKLNVLTKCLIQVHKLYEKIEDEKEVYNNAYYSYSRTNNYLVLPTIIITSLSSMLSFVSSSDIIPQEEKKILLICVRDINFNSKYFSVIILCICFQCKSRNVSKSG